MESLMAFFTVVAGLLFSVAVAVLVEEWIFGGLFRAFFAPAVKVEETERVRRVSR
jgi:hypothetical protein